MKKLTIIMCLAGLILSSCVEEIDLKLERSEYSRLIVDGLITDQPVPQVIKLSNTAAYDSDQPCPPATGASVSVSAGEEVYNFREVTPGIYQSDELTGVIGKTYKLSVWYENEYYTASTTMHPPMQLDSLGFRKFPFGIPKDQPHWEILLYAQDDPDRYECHMLQYAVNGEWQDTLLYSGLYSDWMSNGEYLNGEPVAMYATYDERIKVKLRAVSIDTEYFWYLGNCIWAYMPDMFFSPPRANVKGNISNGALGFFRASAVVETEEYLLEVYQ